MECWLNQEAFFSFKPKCLYLLVCKVDYDTRTYLWSRDTELDILYILANEGVDWFACGVIKFEEWVFSQSIDLFELLLWNDYGLYSHRLFKDKLDASFSFVSLNPLQLRNRLCNLLLLQLFDSVFNVLSLKLKTFDFLNSALSPVLVDHRYRFVIIDRTKEYLLHSNLSLYFGFQIVKNVLDWIFDLIEFLLQSLDLLINLTKKATTWSF